MHRWIIASLAAISLASGSWLFFGTASDEADAASRAETERRPPTVTVARATRQEIAEEVHVSGSLVARDEVLVAPEVDGLAVTAILVEEGDRVEAGEVLARLSRSTVEAEAAQAEAAIAQGQAQIAEAEATVLESKQALERAQSLIKSDAVSKASYDQRLSASQVAEARLNAARHSLKVAEAQKQQIDVRLARTEIKAPTAGIISRRTVKLGAIASMAAEPSFRIIEDGAVELQADVIDSTLARLKTGQNVRVSTAGASEPLVGAVRLISPEVNTGTRLGRVRVSLPLDANVTIGSFATGVVEIGRQKSVTVPISAVAFTNGKSTAQLVADSKVVTREVAIGLRSPTHLEVLSGLSEGDLVVARAGSFLRDGDAVSPVETNTEASAK